MTIQDALRLYNIPYIVTSIQEGDGYKQYKLAPAASGATIEKLQRRLKDVQIATGVRYDLVIENETDLYLTCKTKQAFYDWYDYNGHLDFDNPDIPFMVGFTPSGQLITDTIKNCPHLLVSGTTGSGKSIFLHTFIKSCISNTTNMWLVDCKQVEFSIYEKMCNVAYSVFGEPCAAKFIYHLVDVMEARNTAIKQAGYRDFETWQKANPKERRHILVIDELSDLLSDREAFTTLMPYLLRLAQKGRSSGIHIVLATQRPDANVINGTIKANIPTRIAFHAITNTDSRVILDRGGAEKLTGKGDALYLSNGAQSLQRVQAPYIDVEMIKEGIRRSLSQTA